jgi:hypothetical protein
MLPWGWTISAEARLDRKTIEELHREMEKLDQVIATLEELQGVVTGATQIKILGEYPRIRRAMGERSNLR